jgi:homoserine dehydrogenase
MTTQVIKCGGSILGSDQAIADVADLLAARATADSPLIVVVSAPAGVTDVLFGEIPLQASTSSVEIVEHVSQGEQRMVVELAEHLQNRGVAAHPVNVADIGLHASGHPLDADLVSLDIPSLQAILQRSPITLVPGFVGIDHSGTKRLLGRGGSDLTAVFLAAELNSQCEMIQFIEGVYEYDPAHTRSARFSQMHWDDLLDLDNQVVQPKAVRLAKQRGLAFLVRGVSATAPGTMVGDMTAKLVQDETSNANL